MKLLLIVFSVFVIGQLFADEAISLGEVPWTDGGYNWTWEGRKPPVINKNMFGNTITIAGEKYQKGIAGHTGFSVVYNLSGMALSFSALAGIDDENHPKDPVDMTESSVKVVILVDRKEVFRQVVHLNRKPIPIKLDLRGKQQLELRGLYDQGFKKQRIVFVNPEITVQNRKEFIKQAKDWQQKLAEVKKNKPRYPATPGWKKVSVKKVTWQHWQNAYRINNGRIELIVLPELGGRIISLKKVDADNVLFQQQKLDLPRIGIRGLKQQHGGHFSRPKPLNYFHPASPELILGKYDITFPEKGRIVMTSPPCYVTFLQYQYEISIKPNQNSFTLVTSHKNIAPFKQQAGVWSITRVPTDKVAAFGFQGKVDNNKYLPSLYKPDTLPQMLITNAPWQMLSFSRKDVKEALKRKYGCVEVQLVPDKPITMLQLKNGSQLIKEFNLNPKDIGFFPRFRPVHFYACNAFLENEVHGPTKVLVPGAKTSLIEVFTLK